MVLIVAIIALALLFDFLNGMNDAANSVATIVSTRVLSPKQAVVWAAFFNFIAVFFFGVHVATTIGQGIVVTSVITPPLLLVTLVSAILWTYGCTRIGLPISVSHALVGGLIGAGLAKGGIHALEFSGIFKVCLFIVLSPLIGMFMGYVIMVIVYRICYHFHLVPRTVDKWFRKLQLFSAALYSLGHGSNDAQKTMGIIAVLLYSTGHLGKVFHIPFWVILSCYSSIALGTLLGGWKVIATLGMKMTKLRPAHAFSSETAAAFSILLSSFMGIPVSTTHTITGGIIGVGATTSLSGIRWGVAYRIVWAWVLTIPSTAVVSAFLWFLVSPLL